MSRISLLLLIPAVSVLLAGKAINGQVTVTDVASICVGVGDTAVFPWNYDLGGGVLDTIQWVKLPTTPLLNFFNGTTTARDPRASTNGSAYLLLSGVTAEDAGNYRCTVTRNTDFSFKADEAELRINSEPQNVTCTRDMTVNVTDSFSLQCSSDDEVCPSVHYDWKWPPYAANIINSTSGTLMIEGVNSSKSGPWNYICTASNTVGSETCQTSVTVQCPPETAEPREDIVDVTFDQLYQSTTLTVTVLAIPEATIIWTRLGSEIKRSSEQFLEVTAAGRYTCRAENMLGSTSCKEFNVTVTIGLLVAVIVVPTVTGVSIIIIVIIVIVIRKKKRRGTMMSSSSTKPGENNRNESAEPQRPSETNRPV